MIRTPAALIPWLLALAAIAAGLLWYASNLAGDIGGYGTPRVGGPFTLTDQNGHSVSDRTWRGRYRLIYFGYTQCPDVCPTTLSVMSQALSKLGSEADRIVPIFITVDPTRDTPKVLKSYVAAFGPRFVGLTGSSAAIARVAKEYVVYYKRQPVKGGGYSMDHSSTIYLMGPDGKFLANYDESIGPDALADALRKQM